MTKTVEIVLISSIPEARKTLYLDIIKGRAKERTDWHLVVTSDSIGLKLCKDTANGKGLEDDTKKKLCSTHYATLSVAENFPAYVVGSDDYKKEMKEARTHFSSCINRALVSLGYRPKKAVAESSEKEATTPTTTTAAAVTTAVATFSAHVMSLLHEAQRISKETVAKVAEFQTLGKLSNVQTAAIGSVASFAMLTTEAIDKVEQALEAGKAPATDLDERTMLVPQPAQPAETVPA